MEYLKDDDFFVFNSQKRLYANRGIIGLDTKGNIYEGFDGKITEDNLTLDEQLELACFMETQWAIKKIEIIAEKLNEGRRKK